MDLKQMVKNSLHSLLEVGKFGKRNEMYHLRKAVDDPKNSSVTCGQGKPREKIKRNVRPRTKRNGKWP